MFDFRYLYVCFFYFGGFLGEILLLLVAFYVFGDMKYFFKAGFR